MRGRSGRRRPFEIRTVAWLREPVILALASVFVARGLLLRAAMNAHERLHTAGSLPLDSVRRAAWCALRLGAWCGVLASLGSAHAERGGPMRFELVEPSDVAAEAVASSATLVAFASGGRVWLSADGAETFRVIALGRRHAAPRGLAGERHLLERTTALDASAPEDRPLRGFEASRRVVESKGRQSALSTGAE